MSNQKTKAHAQALPVMHLAPRGHYRSGDIVTTYCGRRFTLGRDADTEATGHAPTAYVSCPVCEAAQIVNNAQIRPEQGRLW